MAESAFLRRVFRSSPSEGYTVMPMLAVAKRSWPPTTNRSAKPLLMRRVTNKASCSYWRLARSTVNSSPPKRKTGGAGLSLSGRETKSLVRTLSESRSATCRNSLSPVPWPKESLMDLKLSMSTKSSASGFLLLRAARRAKATCSENIRLLGRPVNPS